MGILAASSSVVAVFLATAGIVLCALPISLGLAHKPTRMTR
jgi:hypothetical protein